MCVCARARFPKSVPCIKIARQGRGKYQVPLIRYAAYEFLKGRETVWTERQSKESRSKKDKRRHKNGTAYERFVRTALHWA